MHELQIVPDKLVVEDKHVEDYPMDKPKIELDKQVIEDQHVKESSVTSINLLNCGTIIEDNNADIPFKQKGKGKLQLQELIIFYGNTKVSKLSNVSNLQIFSQNIRGLRNKIDKLIINRVSDEPHILYLSEDHLSMEIIQTIIIDNYNLGAYYCKKYVKCGGICIFIHKSYHFINMD
jgi:hypothetical protein